MYTRGPNASDGGQPRRRHRPVCGGCGVTASLAAIGDVFSLPFVQRGVAEVLLLAVGAGLLGTWIVLRGLAFYSHAVGTAAFPGLVVADGLGFAAPIGAFAAAALFAAAVGRLADSRRRGYDVVTAL